MFLAKIVFIVFTYTALTSYVFAQGDEEETDYKQEPGQPAADATEELDEKIEEEETSPPPVDSHTFVALIDIVYTDGAKRTCTGTIIHDNVIITAAHCFSDHNSYVQAELTASFVVIGTKRMFETGYENYLPIERVITHPKYKGWTADIALIYTFAGMTSDKPGNVIPLVGENTLTPVDSNVTILSWGHCKDEPPDSHTRGPSIVVSPAEKRIYDSSDDDAETFPYQYGRQGPEVPVTAKMQSRLATVHVGYDKRPSKVKKYSKYVTRGDSETEATRLTTTKFSNRYLTSSEVKKKSKRKRRKRVKKPQPREHRFHKAQRIINSSEDAMIMMDMGKLKLKLLLGPTHSVNKTDETRREERLMLERERKRKHSVGEEGNVLDKKEQSKGRQKNKNPKYKNWRRQLGTKENRLTVETFGFVNVQTCKKIVDRALPSVYSINPNFVVCYASEDHYINDEDSGAPAIRQGQLVAVTLGGVECEGDHVAVGIKMSCLCSWIADNLPHGENHTKCCKNCCNDNYEEKYANDIKRNKYLLNS